MVTAGVEDFFQKYWPEKIEQNKYLYPSFVVQPTPGNHDNYKTATPNFLPPPFNYFSPSRGFKRKVMPRWLSFFEALLKDNSKMTTSSTYFVGDKLTYADISVFDALDTVLSLQPDALDTYPRLKGFLQRMEQRPRISQYINSRPRSGL